jgi:uroporphyrinogen decarboxylase
MAFQPPDRVPVQYYYTPVGAYEHGEKLNAVYATLPGDFGPILALPPCGPNPGDYDADGSYHALRRDDWGTLWQYRIFGVTGIPAQYPLADIARLDGYTPPPPPPLGGPDFDTYCRRVAEHQRQYYCLEHGGSLFERMIALRPEADVLCDIALDETAIHRLADTICEYNAALINRAVAAGADGIAFGDDYGTERGMILSPDTWRRFLSPGCRPFLPRRSGRAWPSISTAAGRSSPFWRICAKSALPRCGPSCPPTTWQRWRPAAAAWAWPWPSTPIGPAR